MYSIFVAIGIIGMIATFLLPETFHEPLPECIEDIDVRKIHPFLSWRVWLKEEEDTEDVATIDISNSEI